MAIRRLLHRAGLRYRVDRRPIALLNRRADIVFVRERIAVFVDGCFWHGCPAHATWPKANAEFWRTKIEKTMARDRETATRLLAEGWTVIRAWEHEEPAAVATRVVEAVGKVRGGRRQP